MIDRRSVLSQLGFLLVPLAGCSSFGEEPDEEEERLDVDVMNISGKSQVITVEITSGNETIFKRKYDMFADEGDQSQSISAVPDFVSVDVAGGLSKTFEFRPASDCHYDSPRVVLTIYRSDDVGLTYGCAR